MKVGASGAATAVGGPAAGAGVAAGLGAAEGALKGGTLKDMLMGGATGAGEAYLSGGLDASKAPMDLPIPDVPDYNTVLKINTPTNLLDALKFDYSK